MTFGKDNLSEVLSNIWESDKNGVEARYDFPKSKTTDFIVIVSSTNEKYSAKPNKHHKLLKLYKWNNSTNKYQKSSNKEFLTHNKSFELVYHLLDNYESDDSKPEVNTHKENKEIDDFVQYIINTKPMEIALQYLNNKFKSEGRSTWSAKTFAYKITKLWFHQFDTSYAKGLSGFEHTFIGERTSTQMKGYHFWYMYFLDDGMENHTKKDIIEFNKRVDDGSTPNYVAVRFKKLEDLDGDGEIEHNERIFKSIASFFNGCSAECMIAMGTIAYFETKPVWKQNGRGNKEQVLKVNIDNHSYGLKIFRGGPKNSYIRTFFPDKEE